MNEAALTTPVPPNFYRVEKEIDTNAPWSLGSKLAILAAILVVGGTAGALSITQPFADSSSFSCYRDVAQSDIIWILDQSGSVGVDNYNLLKDSIEHLSSNFTIRQSSTRFGAIEFSSGSPTEYPRHSLAIDLNESDSFEEWQDNLARLKWRSGSTNVASVFRYLEEVYFPNPANQRDGADSRIVIFVGDGIPTLPACWNETSFPGSNLCPDDPSCEWAASGVDAQGNTCENHWYPSFPTRSAWEALLSLRSSFEFDFVFLAIENEDGATVSNLFGSMEENEFGVYQENDEIFVTSFDSLSVDLATKFNLDCSVTVET
eukprot:CAMPEP_0184012528 /NCGR_PEP_ID=MMETSP0954-20121128/4470_1 /TAXON_ID=627963 /ORGANISM="Aplanochytrium sp, Strain PBS07" /LENGTH=317 /DNA_ID=CAMNT_0026292541 /DNA_START=377 /DNA_END=1330 /DNA_ORIENTATION=+